LHQSKSGTEPIKPAPRDQAPVRPHRLRRLCTDKRQRVIEHAVPGSAEGGGDVRPEIPPGYANGGRNSRPRSYRLPRRPWNGRDLAVGQARFEPSLRPDDYFASGPQIAARRKPGRADNRARGGSREPGIGERVNPADPREAPRISADWRPLPENARTVQSRIMNPFWGGRKNRRIRRAANFSPAERRDTIGSLKVRLVCGSRSLLSCARSHAPTWRSAKSRDPRSAARLR
jgi:hypothetical protein